MNQHRRFLKPFSRLLSPIAAAAFLCANPALAQSDTAAETDYNFRVLVPFGKTDASGSVLYTGKTPASLPAYDAKSDTLYGITNQGGEGGTTDGVSWTLNLASGKYQWSSNSTASLGYSLTGGLQTDADGNIWGSRQHFEASTFTPTAQTGGFFKWTPRSALPAFVTSTAPEDFLAPLGQWSFDAAGNLYFPSDEGVYRRAADGQVINLYETSNDKTLVPGQSNEYYYPKGWVPQAVLHSATDKGLYVLSRNGDISNNIPEGDSVGGTLAFIADTDAKAGGTSAMQVLHTFAKTRDGSVTTNGQYNSLLEVGDWLYGTTGTSIWRYKRGTPGSFQRIHQFGSGEHGIEKVNDGSTARGSIVLAEDGNIYGVTSLDGRASNDNPAGIVWRLIPGSIDDVTDERYEIVHRFTYQTDGAQLQGLLTGPLGKNEAGSTIQTLIGAAQAGGEGSTANTRGRYSGGNGTIFAFDINAPQSGTVSLKLDKTSITVGEAATLTWTAENTSQCTASGDSFSGDREGSGSEQVQPTQAGTVTYTLTCTDERNEEVKASTSLTVNAANNGGGDTGGNGTDDGGNGGGGGSSGWLMLAVLALAGSLRFKARKRIQI